ncbi:MAG: pyridoxamine 5'-phosphate oxidase family protein [Halobacteriota archaeon]|nr:pyridoxamine 5'-phosphate oxidase family protein [Halobacteriota archaeon]
MSIEGLNRDELSKKAKEIKGKKDKLKIGIEITEEMKEVLESMYEPSYSRLLPYRVRYLGTSSSDGVPNVNIVSLIKVIDKDKIMMADATFMKTRNNIEENPRASLIAEEYRNWDFSEKKMAKVTPPSNLLNITGWQFKGKIELEKDGENFDIANKMCLEKFGPIFMLYAAVIFHVDEIYSTVTGQLIQKRA